MSPQTAASLRPSAPGTSARLTSSLRHSVLSAALLSPLVLAGLAGCKSHPSAPDDAALASSVNSQLAADSSLASLPLQAAVQGGIVTLSGAVLNDAQRTIAARDAAGVNGVREVIDNVTVGPPPAATASAPAPAPIPLQQHKPATALIPRSKPSAGSAYTAQHSPAPIERETPPPAQNAYNPAPSAPAAPPPPPPQPAYRSVTIPSGTTLAVRVTQTLDSATTQPGESFSGALASDVTVDGLTALPQGAAVSGNVDAVQEAAHFKGNSLLTVSLTSVRARGERLPVSVDPYSVKGNGRGKNTAEKAGGGAAVGAILGGIFGGGKGAAIGAAAGGGAGAGVNAVTRGQQVQIPSETVVRFHTISPITVRVRTDGGRDRDSDSDLQHRPS